VIRPARADEMDAVRDLFREYATWVGSPICFEQFERELANLPGEYDPLLVAEVSGELAGCAALRKLAPAIGEMKRLYVRPAFRGQGLGRQLIARIVNEAKTAGCRVLRLDTLPVMESAQTLYRELGFREIPPYGDNPPEAICFELQL
jgi:N-acetylglutamate synthase-like GNAT family acetyltransferase